MTEKNKNKAQVWIETVLYTIIGLAIIAMVLAFIMPKINETKDKLVIEQSIDTLKTLDQKIQEVAKQSGNVGQVELRLRRGELYINVSKDKLTLYVDELGYLYSESGMIIKEGRIDILSNKGQNKNSVSLTTSYNYNITFNGNNIETKKINPSSSSYFLTIENLNNTQINIKESQ